MTTRMDPFQSALERDVAKVRVEQEETKQMAAKALTTADQTKQQLVQLTQRASALESQPRQPTRGVGGRNSVEGLGYDSLQVGGPRGNLVIIGKFDSFASRATRNACWDLIRAALSPELAAQIQHIETPGLRSPIILAHLHEDPAGPAQTRDKMMAFCKKIREGKYSYSVDGTTWDIYASPSKSFEQRQLDAASTL